MCETGYRPHSGQENQMRILTQDGLNVHILHRGSMVGCQRARDCDDFEVFINRYGLLDDVEGKIVIGKYPSGRCKDVITELFNAMRLRDWFKMPPCEDDYAYELQRKDGA